MSPKKKRTNKIGLSQFPHKSHAELYFFKKGVNMSLNGKTPKQLKLEVFELDQRGALFHAKIPVAEHISKKNNRPILKNRRTGISFIGKGDRLKSAEQALLYNLQRRASDMGLAEPIKGNLWALFKFYFPGSKLYTRKEIRSSRIPDLSNLYELPQDCLQAARIIKNDNQIQAHDGSRILESPDSNHYLEIFLFSFTLIQKIDEN